MRADGTFECGTRWAHGGEAGQLHAWNGHEKEEHLAEDANDLAELGHHEGVGEHNHVAWGEGGGDLQPEAGARVMTAVRWES
jgi:hypothetical protein